MNQASSRKARTPRDTCETDELEEAFHAILELPEDRREGAVERLVERHPEREATLWRWLAITRHLSEPPITTTPRRCALMGRPERLGAYRIERSIGQGGMGTVYLATHEVLERRVALKLIRADLLDHPEAHSRFRREMQALSRVDHPGLCKVFEIGEEQGIPYMVMPYLEGQDLATRLREHARTNAAPPVDIGPAQATEVEPPSFRERLSRLLRFFAESARALHAAHQAGLIHRDVKPGNLFVLPGPHPVVLDFGLVRDERSREATLVGSHELLGTIEYMAPEQVRCERSLDARTDVHSLAATLYEALTGRLPFQGDNRQETLARILVFDPPSVRQLVPGLSRDLARVVAKALEKDPRRRYATALEFAEDLERAERHEPVTAHRRNPLGLAVRRASRHPWVTATFLTLALFLGVSLVLLVERDRAIRAERSALASAQDALEKFQLTEYAVLLERARARLEELPWATSAEHAALLDWMNRFGVPLTGALPCLRSKRDQMRAAGGAREDEGERRLELRGLREARERFRKRLDPLDPEREIDALWAELGRLQLGDVDARIALLERELEASPSLRFDDGSTTFLLRALDDLVRDLENFLERDPEGLRLVESHLRLCERQDRESEPHAWSVARRSIREDTRYAGLDLPPQRSLVPLGRDPDSGLFEFAHEPSGRIPNRVEGRLEVDGESAIVLVLLPPGTFDFGSQRFDERAPNYDRLSPSDMGPYSVRLDAFFIAKHELTQGQWKRLGDGENPSYFRAGNVPVPQVATDSHPVENVSWNQAMRTLRRYGLLLPTEAQWEYACRAGSDAAFAFGPEAADLEGFANLAGEEMARSPLNLLGGPAPFDDGSELPLVVDALAPNGFGLHHIVGNVSEWCRDGFWTLRTSLRDGDGFVEVPLPRYRSIRGGSYLEGWLVARVAHRSKAPPHAQGNAIGVRPVRAVHRE